jgi:hypothetical protein
VQKAASAADADAPSLMPNHHRCMTVESVSTTTPVLYHNHLHHRSAPSPRHGLISLCLPRNIDYIQCRASSSSLCIALCRANRAACSSCCCCCCSSPLAYYRPTGVSRLFTHPGPSNLQRISLTYTLVPSHATAGLASHEKDPCMNASLLLRRPHPSSSVSLNHAHGNADPT